jgi:hypothetical protein
MKVHKFAGDNQCKDLEITPTNGIVQVYKMVNGHMTDVNGMIVYPNPTEDYVTVKFEVKEYGNVRLSVYGVDGKEYKVMVNDKMPQGDYQYSTNLGYLPSGVYMAVLKRSDIQLTSKIILK